MKLKFEKVPVRGINAEEVLALWRKGKLYRKVEAEQVSEEEMLVRCRREALAYVSRIDEYVADVWRANIKEVWERVLNDEAFEAGLLMRQKRQLNRYFLTSIVFNLQILGIYRPVEEVSQQRLHLTLERVTRKNSIFKGCGNYAVSVAQRKRLKALLCEFSSSLK